MKETKVCKICGLELPLNKFQKYYKKDREVAYSHQCRRCSRAKYEMKLSSNPINIPQDMLKKVKDECLINELLNRGYYIKKG